MFDRLLLIALCVTVVKLPVFIGPFLFLLSAISWQFHYPAFSYGWFFTDKRLLFDSLVLFYSFMIVRRLLFLRSREFMFLTLCLAASFYCRAGIAKIMLGPSVLTWAFDNRLSNLVVSSRLFGWLDWMAIEDVVAMSQWLQALHLLMSIGTLVIEVGAIALLFGRSPARLCLAALLLLHVMILVTSGILFWTWMAFDLVLIAALTIVKRKSFDLIFTRKRRLFGVAIALLGFVVFHPIPFGWFDTNYVTHYRVMVEDRVGRELELHPYLFSLYDIEMGQRRYGFLDTEPVVVGTYGSVLGYKTVTALRESSVRNVAAIVRTNGRTEHNQVRRDRFILFLKKWLTGMANEPSFLIKHLRILAPPHHFRTGLPGNLYHSEFGATRVFIVRTDYLFTQGEVHKVADHTLVDTKVDDRAFD